MYTGDRTPQQPPADDQPRVDSSPSSELATLRAQAEHVADGTAAAEDNLNRWRRDRSHLMARMSQAGLTWAEIGRIFKVTPQAAMYGSGLVKRSERRKS